MKTKGVWIDHRQARIFEVTDGQPPRASESRRIESGAEEVTRTTGHVANVPAHGVGGSGDAERQRTERRRAKQLGDFYKDVGQALADAEQIVIVGPGSARNELATALQADRKTQGRVKRIESIDTHLTDGQVAARIAELATKPF